MVSWLESSGGDLRHQDARPLKRLGFLGAFRVYNFRNATTDRDRTGKLDGALPRGKHLLRHRLGVILRHGGGRIVPRAVLGNCNLRASGSSVRAADMVAMAEALSDVDAGDTGRRHPFCRVDELELGRSSAGLGTRFG